MRVLKSRGILKGVGEVSNPPSLVCVTRLRKHMSELNECYWEVNAKVFCSREESSSLRNSVEPYKG